MVTAYPLPTHEVLTYAKVHTTHTHKDKTKPHGLRGSRPHYGLTPRAKALTPHAKIVYIPANGFFPESLETVELDA